MNKKQWIAFAIKKWNINEKEAEEYLRYIDFLTENGELKKEVEYLELKNLPGVSGLKALRVEVTIQSASKNQKSQDILKAAKQVIST